MVSDKLNMVIPEKDHHRVSLQKPGRKVNKLKLNGNRGVTLKSKKFKF
jgi:hypothetical protein